ncbi:hypothetical protein NPIL_247781 [Nephila pilipes]|uniref:Uncharacterized protein n=1 Tax=Nephila pilipes TaxID=299642 RepID=A0A8X6KI56_NEPPI|nr:hypothetical protein NPIL_247781 [Nephila pilipes]
MDMNQCRVQYRKKLASDLLLSTTAYEALREKSQMYGHESPSNEDDVHVASEEETENPSVSTEALVELLSTESSNENGTQSFSSAVIRWFECSIWNS